MKKVSLKDFKAAMLAAEASGAVDKIEVPAQKPAKKINVFGKFFPKTPEGKKAFWKPILRRYNITSKKLEAYAVRYAVDRGWLNPEEAAEQPYSWSGNVTPGIDNLSLSLGLEKNSLRNSGWGFCYLGDEEDVSESRKADRYLAVAQFLGFMIALESTNEEGKLNYPALAAIQRRARSGRGHNSPATGKFVHQYNAVRYKMNKGEKSPGALERKIWAVKEAALKKHRVHISFEMALEAIGVVGLHAVSKAATVAYALKLGGASYEYWSEDFSPFRTYKEAREFVVNVITARKSEAVVLDEVETYLIDEPQKKGAIMAQKAVWFHKPEYRGARAHWVIGTVFQHPVEGSFHTKKGWEMALYTFRERKKLRLESAGLTELTHPDKGILVYLQDSYDAGNCIPGTTEWLNRVGFSGKKILPLWQVYEAAVKSGNQLAMNVVKKVVAEVTTKEVA